MVRKILWMSPEDTTVTNIEVSTSATQYGAYAVATTMDSTSDGAAKSSSNTWVTNYTDQTGARTTWYKVRFYDGTNYSDYSEPVTSEEHTKLCSVDDIKKSLNTVGRWTDSEVFDAIIEEDELIYTEGGTPLQAIWSETGKINSTLQELYYVGEENIQRVDRVYYGTTTKEELFLDDDYQVNEAHGMLKILTSAVTLDVNKDIEIQFAPKIYNKLCSYRAIRNLLQQVDTVSGGNTSKELEVINNKITQVETILANRVALAVSGKYKNYDKYYGVNREYLVQDFDRNRYVSSTGNLNW